MEASALIIRRHEHWPEALAHHLEANKATPLEYGAWDCWLATCDAVRAMTGVDLGAEWRGGYQGRDAALARAGGDFGGAFASQVTDYLGSLGLREVPPLRAGRGDIALVEVPEGVAVGVVDMSGTHVAVASEKGLGRASLRRALRAWAVP